MWKFEINDSLSHNGYYVNWFRFVTSKTKIGIKIKRFLFSIFNFKNNYIGVIYKV